MSLLSIRDLSVKFRIKGGFVKAVENVTFRMDNETVAVIGETGSGKSVMGVAILRLLPKNAIVSGEIVFGGRNLLELPEGEMRGVRGREIAFIPQNSAAAFNPLMRISDQIMEGWQVHSLYRESGKSLMRRVVELLSFFGVSPAKRKANEYPHRLSGGELQRSLVAMGVSMKPKLVIADEPTKGVDVVRKSSILEAFEKLRGKGIALLIITHDLTFAEKIADKIAVMYRGNIVEFGKFFPEPLHPYSKSLLDSLPSRGLNPMPDGKEVRGGCGFRGRCKFARDKCSETPPFVEVGKNRVRCWLYA